MDLVDTSMTEQEDIQLALCQRPEYGEAKEQLASIEALLEREKSAPYGPNLRAQMQLLWARGWAYSNID